MAGHDVYIVVGSDVVANASSYKKQPGENTIHSLNHIIFQRITEEHHTATEDSYVENKKRINGHIVELTLPVQLEDISSTRIRDNIDNNRDISSLIDPVVQNFIYDHSLYMRSPQYKYTVRMEDMNFWVSQTDGISAPTRVWRG